MCTYVREKLIHSIATFWPELVGMLQQLRNQLFHMIQELHEIGRDHFPVKLCNILVCSLGFHSLSVAGLKKLGNHLGTSNHGCIWKNNFVRDYRVMQDSILMGARF